MQYDRLLLENLLDSYENILSAIEQNKKPMYIRELEYQIYHTPNYVYFKGNYENESNRVKTKKEKNME